MSLFLWLQKYLLLCYTQLVVFSLATSAEAFCSSLPPSSRFAFSRNGQPTLLAKTNPSLDFGRATTMSVNDIARINRLYKCCEKNIKLLKISLAFPAARITYSAFSLNLNVNRIKEKLQRYPGSALTCSSHKISSQSNRNFSSAVSFTAYLYNYITAEDSCLLQKETDFRSNSKKRTAGSPAGRVWYYISIC